MKQNHLSVIEKSIRVWAILLCSLRGNPCPRFRPPHLQHNVAEQLARMAKGARSMDDISIIVVTFKGGKDKGAPGSKGPLGEGAPVSVEASL